MPKYNKKVVETPAETIEKETEAVEVKTETVEVKAPSAAEQENELLKKQLAELQAQMAVMMQAVSNKQETSVQEDRNILFVNLYSGTLVLKGTHTTYKLEGQFAQRMFSLHEAKSIVMNTPRLVASGRLYVADDEFLKDVGMKDAFANILSDKQLKSLMNKPYTEIIEIYKNVPDDQKKIIVDMIINDKMMGRYVDGNVLIEIGKLCGRDLTSIERKEDIE